MSVKPDNLIWIDLEMTGLNTDSDRIIEIATIVTDAQLHIVAEGPVFAIHQPDEILAKMDNWCTKQHRSSGLTERVVESRTTEREAELATLEFVKKYVPAKKSPMCGNSICQDRRFLYRVMPELEQFFHYRNLDVSTLKELGMRWYPKIMSSYKKNTKHLALDDIRDSIAELRFYRDQFFIPSY